MRRIFLLIVVVMMCMVVIGVDSMLFVEGFIDVCYIFVSEDFIYLGKY